MQTTGVVKSIKANNRGVAFLALTNEEDQSTVMFMSDSNDSNFCGQTLTQGQRVTFKYLSEKTLKHGSSVFYTPHKVFVHNDQESSRMDSTQPSTETKEESTQPKQPKKTAPVPHKRQPKVYGRISKLDLKASTFTLTVLNDGKETGEVYNVSIPQGKVPRDIENGKRINCNLELTEDATLLQATHRMYDDERKGHEERLTKIIYGNARNVAITAVGAKDLDKMNKLAMDIYTKGKVKREELAQEFDLDEFDLGAKWGDCLKQAAGEYKTCTKILGLAETLFRNHVEIEKGLL